MLTATFDDNETPALGRGIEHRNIAERILQSANIVRASSLVHVDEISV